MMNIRLSLYLLVLLAFAPLAQAAGQTNAWFSGMRNPPKVTLALPTNYIVVSASAETKTTKQFNMEDGVVWAPERTARRFEFGADRKFKNLKDPMFFAALSAEVAQQPGGDTFTNEKNIVANYSGAGLKNVKSTKTKWGSYPVLTLTGDRPDGSPIFVAWVGINSPEGWTILVDYRLPSGKGHPSDEEKKIWDNFLNQTKAEK